MVQDVPLASSDQLSWFDSLSPYCFERGRVGKGKGLNAMDALYIKKVRNIIFNKSLQLCMRKLEYD